LLGRFEGKVKRKTFVAREDLLDRLSKVAEAKGYSLYALVNEIFEIALKIDDLGLDLRRIVEERSVLERAKRAGFILGLENLFYGMADIAFSRARNKAIETWYEAGVWFAKCYTTSLYSNPLEALKRDLESFIWNANFTMDWDDETLTVKVMSPRFTEAYTFLLSAFFEGAFYALNYRVVEREVFKGNIQLTARREGHVKE